MFTIPPLLSKPFPYAARVLACFFSVFSCLIGSTLGDQRNGADAKSVDGGDDTGIAYFETHVRPLLFHHCYACHSTSAGKSEGNLVLDSREGWMKGGDQGPAIVPGDPASSLLIQAVRYQDSGLQMPPVAPLAEEEIAKLEQWVKLGAPAPLHTNAPALTPHRIRLPGSNIGHSSRWLNRIL